MSRTGRSSGGRDSPGRYSDDFVSDDDDDRSDTSDRRYRHDRFRGGIGRGRALPLRGRGRGQRGQGRGVRRGRGTSRNSEPADMRNLDHVASRVMSASRNRINELRNKVEEMKLKMREMEQENKLYKKLQYRQEKAIRTFEDKESDLPNIIDKHNNEVRSLKEQNRRLREKHEKTDRYLRDAEDELERVKRKMAKYKKLCDEKELAERDELARKVTKSELDLEERDCKIKELQRHVESLKKNHRHELGIEGARQKDLKKQLAEAQEQNTTLSTNVKEKEKALEYANIYSNPNRNVSHTRDSSLSPGRGRTKSKASSMTDLTPRDKAKFYAEKKRAELAKQREIKAEQEKKKKQKWEEEEKERQAKEEIEKMEREEREREEQEREKREKENASARVQSPPQFNFRSIDKSLEEREEQERRRKFEDQRLLREKQDKEAKEELDRKRLELERRRDQENRDKKERDDREERERKEREEKARREREREEQERRARLEKEKLDNDPILQEERRKKDELLRKLEAMDNLGSAGNDPAPDPFDTQTHSSASRHSKENSRMAGGDGFDSAGKRSDPKEYSFTKPINNLHMGKPAHEEKVSTRQVKQQGRKPMTLTSGNQDQDGNFGYQPSFGPPGATRAPGKGLGSSSTKPLSIFDDDKDDDIGAFKISSNSKPSPAKKSTNLLENLFGPQAGTSINDSSTNKNGDEGKTFFVTSQASMSPILDTTSTNNQKAGKVNGSTTQFPWDTKSNTTKTNRTVFDSNRDNSSTLFGGGAALIDDDFSSPSNKILPKRRQQANFSTFSSKPSVIALDNFDDDIEEVVL